jgi:HEAT repeats
MYINSADKIIYQLLDNWRNSDFDKQAGIRSLLENKETALPILIGELSNINSQYDWSLVGFLLRKLESYAFDEVIKVSLSDDSEISRRGNWTAADFGDTALEKVIENLKHTSPIIRANMAYAIQCSKHDTKNLIPQIIGLLEDEDPEVRKRAMHVLGNYGEDIIESLLMAREKGRKDLRKAALVALLNYSPNSITEFDKELIRRLDRIVAKYDPPTSFDDNSWIVIPKTELNTILEVCKLHEPEIVPFRKGLDAVGCDFWHFKSDIEYPSRTRVFITPIIDDKWIFIIGGSFAVADGDSQKRVNAILIELSKKLNKAYCFTSQLRMGFYSWTIAMNGEIIRQHVGEGNIIDLGFLTIPEIEIREKKKANGEDIDEEYLIDWLPYMSNYFCIHPDIISAMRQR